MPTLVTSREGENCDASIFGNVLELRPRLYTSGGYTDKWWLSNAGFRGLSPGAEYELWCPTADCQWGGTQAGRTHIMLSHDGLDPNNPAKQWGPHFGGVTNGGYRKWAFTAQSSTIECAMGLPATWALLDQRLFDDWLPYCDDTAASVDTGFEIARTPATIDQRGLVIPEQVQRLWHMGNPDGLPFFFPTGVHSPEMIGSRAWMHGIDLLLSEYTDILDAFHLTLTHTVCPGRYRGHQRGLAVDGGSADPNRAWGQYNATTPFVSAVEDALRIALGGQIQVEMMLDGHSTFRGPAEIRYERNYDAGNVPFFGYIEAANPGVWRGPVAVRARNSTQATAVQSWGARVGMTLEWGDNEGFTDDELTRDMRAVWDGVRAGLADGFYSGAAPVNGWEPPIPADLVWDNQDLNAVRVGSWRESSAQGEYMGSSEFGSDPDGYFQWPAAAPGTHHLEVWFTWHRNRTNRAMYEIEHLHGADTIEVDHSNQANAGQWLRIGTFADVAAVRLRSTYGQVSADAVRLVSTDADQPCQCADLIDDIDTLVTQAGFLLQETSSPIAQDMLDTLIALRADIGG